MSDNAGKLEAREKMLIQPYLKLKFPKPFTTKKRKKEEVGYIFQDNDSEPPRKKVWK